MLQAAINAELVLLELQSMPKEMDVLDQDQFATASKDTLQMVTNASNVVKVKLLTQETTKTVLLLQPVMETTNTEELVIPPPALHAKPAQLDTLSTLKETDAWDQSQLATVSKDTQLTDTNAKTVASMKLLTQTITSNANQHQPVTVPTNID